MSKAGRAVGTGQSHATVFKSLGSEGCETQFRTGHRQMLDGHTWPVDRTAERADNGRRNVDAVLAPCPRHTGARSPRAVAMRKRSSQNDDFIGYLMRSRISSKCQLNCTSRIAEIVRDSGNSSVASCSVERAPGTPRIVYRPYSVYWAMLLDSAACGKFCRFHRSFHYTQALRQNG